MSKIGSTVVLESLVAVGTSERLLTPLYEKGIYVGFSPERETQEEQIHRHGYSKGCIWS